MKGQTSEIKGQILIDRTGVFESTSDFHMRNGYVRHFQICGYHGNLCKMPL